MIRILIWDVKLTADDLPMTVVCQQACTVEEMTEAMGLKFGAERVEYVRPKKTPESIEEVLA